MRIRCRRATAATSTLDLNQERHALHRASSTCHSRIGGVFSAPIFVSAQAQGAATVPARIVGRVVDARTGEGLADVGIQVVGTTTGSSSGLDGRFSLGSVTAGTVTIHLRRLGFAAKTVTGIFLTSGQTIEQNVALEPVTVSLTTQVVTASSERGTVNEALDKQRTAVGVVSAVTREQISRSPDSDAAQAVQRVSGVTVQDGKYVFVRGLGERYTTTSLNGARIPSPEPEKKVVPLDLFPSSLIQTVTTSKNFTADQPGDFSGAQVDIRTREFPARREIQFSSSVGYNDAATNRVLVGAPTLSRDWLGFAGSQRKLPASLAAAGRLDREPSQSDVNTIVGSFRNAWSPLSRNGSPNTSLGFTAGGNGMLGGTGGIHHRAQLFIRSGSPRERSSRLRGTHERDDRDRPLRGEHRALERAVGRHHERQPHVRKQHQVKPQQYVQPKRRQRSPARDGIQRKPRR